MKYAIINRFFSPIHMWKKILRRINNVFPWKKNKITIEKFTCMNFYMLDIEKRCFSQQCDVKRHWPIQSYFSHRHYFKFIFFVFTSSFYLLLITLLFANESTNHVFDLAISNFICRYNYTIALYTRTKTPSQH